MLELSWSRLVKVPSDRNNTPNVHAGAIRLLMVDIYMVRISAVSGIYFSISCPPQAVIAWVDLTRCLRDLSVCYLGTDDGLDGNCNMFAPNDIADNEVSEMGGDVLKLYPDSLWQTIIHKM